MYRRIISHGTEKGSKVWWKSDFLFEKWHEEFGELSSGKVWKFALWWATFAESV